MLISTTNYGPPVKLACRIVIGLVVILSLMHVILSRFAITLFEDSIISLPLTRWGFIYASGELTLASKHMLFNIGYWLLLVVSMVTSYKYYKKNRPGDKLLFITNIFFLLIVTDGYRSEGYELLMSIEYWYLGFLFSLAGLVYLFSTRKDCTVIVHAGMCCIAVQCVIAIINWICNVNQFITPGFGHRTSGSFVNPNTLYPVCLVGFPLSYFMFVFERDRYLRIFYFAVALLSVTALFLTFNRGAAIALASIALLLCKFTPSKTSRFCKYRIVLIAISMVLFISASVLRTQGNLIGNRKDRSYWGRIAVWHVAFRVIMRNPLLGNGLGSYPYQQQELMTRELKGYDPAISEPKNIFLYIVSEFGAIGLLLLAILIFCYVRYFRNASLLLRNYSKEQSIIFGFANGMAGLMFAGLFDTPLIVMDQIPSTLLLSIFTAVSAVFMNVEVGRDKLIGVNI